MKLRLAYFIRANAWDIVFLKISICGFTNGIRAVSCDPMLTTVEQRGLRVGEEAASILIDKAEGSLPLDTVEKRIVRTRLIIRGTTR